MNKLKLVNIFFVFSILLNSNLAMLTLNAEDPSEISSEDNSSDAGAVIAAAVGGVAAGAAVLGIYEYAKYRYNMGKTPLEKDIASLKKQSAIVNLGDPKLTMELKEDINKLLKAKQNVLNNQREVDKYLNNLKGTIPDPQLEEAIRVAKNHLLKSEIASLQTEYETSLNFETKFKPQLEKTLKAVKTTIAKDPLQEMSLRRLESRLEKVIGRTRESTTQIKQKLDAKEIMKNYLQDQELQEKLRLKREKSSLQKAKAQADASKKAETLIKDLDQYQKKADFNPEVSKSLEKLIDNYSRIAIEGPTIQNLKELNLREIELQEVIKKNQAVSTQERLISKMQRPLPATPTQAVAAKPVRPLPAVPTQVVPSTTYEGMVVGTMAPPAPPLSAVQVDTLRAQQEQLLKKLEAARVQSQSVERMQQERAELNKKLQEVEANRIAAETKARESTLQTQKTTQQLEYDKAQEIQKLNQQAEELAAKKAQLEAERQRRIQIFSDNMRLKPFKAKLQAWAQRARERVASGQKFVRK